MGSKSYYHNQIIQPLPNAQAGKVMMFWASGAEEIDDGSDNSDENITKDYPVGSMN